MRRLVNWLKSAWAVAKVMHSNEDGFARGRFRGGGGGGGGISGIITMVLLVFVLFMFVINFVPEIEDAILGFTTTLPMVETMVTLLSWMLPVGALVAALILIFRKVRG